MKILVVGGNGMLGRKLVTKLIQNSIDGKIDVETIICVDVSSNQKDIKKIPVNLKYVTADITNFKVCQQLISKKPDVIFHLAAVVSGEAESNFETGYKVNLDATRNIFEAIRTESNNYYPRVVFTSSAAVYGGPFPELINDEFILQPTTSYGIQKVIGELLVNDYSRLGFFNGIGLRLPTICVRPGKPNAAASGVFSNIIREPLAGQEAILTVSKDTQMVFASPQSAVDNLIHALNVDTTLLGNRRCLTMPGITATIAEEIQALQKVAGDKIVALIKESIDPSAQKFVNNWNFPPFTADRAQGLGFSCEQSFEEIIIKHINNELGGEILGAKL